MHDRLQDLIDWLRYVVDEIKDIFEWTLIHAVYWSPACLIVLVGPEEDFDFLANCFGGDTPEGWLGTLINMAVMFGFIFCIHFAAFCFFRVTMPLWMVEKTNPKCGHTYEVARFDSPSKPPPCETCMLLAAMAKLPTPDWRQPERVADGAESEPDE